MNQIQIIGEVKTFPYEEVKKSVVKVGGSYYWRSSDKIIKVEGRYYRINSPLIIKAYNNLLIRKDRAVEISAGVFAHRDDPELITLEDGSLSLSRFCVNVDGRYYLNSDTRLATCRISGKLLLKDTAIKLDEGIYSSSPYVRKEFKDNLLTTYDNRVVIKKDSVTIIRPDNSTSVAWKGDSFAAPLFRDFINPSNPDFNKVRKAQLLLKDLDEHKDKFTLITADVPQGRAKFTAHINDVPKIRRAEEFVNNVEKRESTAQVKQVLNKFFSGLDSKENKASRISLQYHTHGGGVLFDPHTPPLISAKTTPSGRSLPIVDKTGGLSYTFGVEFETSAGALTDNQCADLGVAKHGDRSIGAFEYTTGILHGNLGVERLKEISKYLNSRCLVDDRCGLHVHIGGHGSSAVTTPKFDQNLAVLAIDLGCQLEPELFQISPPNRRPDLKYCHSILRYNEINFDNWRDVLGAYVFGKEEDEMTDQDLTGKYRIGDQVSMTDSLPRYCAGRYKWLNVVNFCSRSRFKTLEFRIFAGTTDFDKVYNYTLISMAFMWFIENRAGKVIKKSNTLKGVVQEAYAKHPEIVKQVEDFIDDRKKFFNRSEIYINN